MRWSAGFLLLRVQPGGWRRSLLLPLPLFVVEEALEAVALLAPIGWRLGRRRLAAGGLSFARFADVVRLPAAFLRELRRHGPLVLLEVEDGPTHISVRVV